MTSHSFPSASDARERADVESSSEAYARRFAGAVGRWFLELQTTITLSALAGLPAAASVLDVGGGHAQLAPPLVERGYRVTVVGSDPSCERALVPWTSVGRCRFEAADLQHLPYGDAAFSAVLCFRLLAHTVDWSALVRELCRVASDRVIVDYPSRRSVNALSEHLFAMKRSIDGPLTRPFALYRPREIGRAFEENGFRVVTVAPQFLMPMTLYRMARSDRFGRAVEWPARRLGLTRLLGSPIIVRADRRRA